MSEQNNLKVKILVSCHKEVPLPSSDIYLPVQVGSLNKPQLRRMQPDCEGENIADRNFTFCELTAQYGHGRILMLTFMVYAITVAIFVLTELIAPLMTMLK